MQENVADTRVGASCQINETSICLISSAVCGRNRQRWAAACDRDLATKIRAHNPGRPGTSVFDCEHAAQVTVVTAKRELKHAE